MFYTVKNNLESNWPQRTPMGASCVQDSENISSCECYVFTVVPKKLGKVMKYEVNGVKLTSKVKGGLITYTGII